MFLSKLWLFLIALVAAVAREPKELTRYLSKDQLALYRLISSF